MFVSSGWYSLSAKRCDLVGESHEVVAQLTPEVLKIPYPEQNHFAYAPSDPRNRGQTFMYFVSVVLLSLPFSQSTLLVYPTFSALFTFLQRMFQFCFDLGYVCHVTWAGLLGD